METESIKIDVTATSLGFLNTVSIGLSRHVEEFLKDESDASRFHTKLCLRTASKPIPRPYFIKTHVSSDPRRSVEKSTLSTTTSFRDGTESCAICLEDMSESEKKPICELPNCKHLFHEECLVTWLGRHNSCPLCRQAIYQD
ncbi:unnamed protein product [Cochlearia groenlandica]